MLDVWLFGFDIESEIGVAFYVMISLIVFDVLTGILASAVERKVNSSINFNGLIHKGGEILGIAFVVFVDVYLRADGYIIKVGVGLLVLYEIISIIENFSRIGINLSFITKYFEKEKVGKGDERNE